MVDPSLVLPLGELPDTVFEQTLMMLSYHEIAQLRRVNKRFDTTCMALLNKGFRSAERYHTKCLKVIINAKELVCKSYCTQEVKAKLPRRESERRNHKLSRHCDILTAIETRISLLSMTFLKYVDLSLCCFIPGKVIDEIFSVLRTIQADENPPRAYEILQELRDISSMAMEYFDEKIVPSLKVQLPLSPLKFGGTGQYNLGGQYSSEITRIVSHGSGFSLSLRYPESPQTPSGPSRYLEAPNSEPSRPNPRSLLWDFSQVSQSNKKLSKKTNRVVTKLKRQADTYKAAVENQNKKIVELDKRIDQQNEIIHQQNTRLAEQEEKLAEMNRRLMENELLRPNVSAREGRGDSKEDRGRKRQAESLSDDVESKKLKHDDPE